VAKTNMAPLGPWAPHGQRLTRCKLCYFSISLFGLRR
jgi:hypothetical protein